MATTYYKLVGTKNPHTNYSTEARLGDKVVRVGEPVELTKEDRDELDRLGFVVETSSKDEAEQAEQTRVVAGDDVRGNAPVFGNAESPNQSSEQNKTDAKKEV